jgi:hypothetical protein
MAVTWTDFGTIVGGFGFEHATASAAAATRDHERGRRDMR